ncbi:MAG: hypothetical protein ACYCSQ_00275 [bacterium]
MTGNIEEWKCKECNCHNQYWYPAGLPVLICDWDRDENNLHIISEMKECPKRKNRSENDIENKGGK